MPIKMSKCWNLCTLEQATYRHTDIQTERKHISHKGCSFICLLSGDGDCDCERGWAGRSCRCDAEAFTLRFFCITTLSSIQPKLIHHTL